MKKSTPIGQEEVPVNQRISNEAELNRKIAEIKPNTSEEDLFCIGILDKAGHLFAFKEQYCFLEDYGMLQRGASSRSRHDTPAVVIMSELSRTFDRNSDIPYSLQRRCKVLIKDEPTGHPCYLPPFNSNGSIVYCMSKENAAKAKELLEEKIVDIQRSNKFQFVFCDLSVDINNKPSHWKVIKNRAE